MEDRLVKIGRILLGFMFIFSALSKLVSMPFFDSMVAELILGPEYYDNGKGMFWTQILTRVLIAAELLLGVAVLQKRWLKKLVLPALMGMLILFTIHLFYEGFRQPNGFTEGNCGCFGDVLPMNNLESIIKNVVAMLIGIFVWRKYRDLPNQQLASWVSPVLIGATTLFTLWFGIKTYDEPQNPVNLSTDIAAPTIDSLAGDSLPLDTVNLLEPDEESSTTEEDPVDDENTNIVVTEPASVGVKDDNNATKDDDPNDDVPIMEVTPSQHTINMLSKYNKFSNGAKINFESGTNLICLFSMTCSHCQEVYKEMCGAQ